MLALAGACFFASCSDDDDDDDNTPVVMGAYSFKGTSTASMTMVFPLDIKMENDTVSVIPMTGSTPEMVEVRFAAREMSVMDGVLNVVMDGFAIDSCLVTRSTGGFTLSRKNNFAVKGVKVSLGASTTEQTVSGKFTSASLNAGRFTLKLDDVKAHEDMPTTMSLSFEGQK